MRDARRWQSALLGVAAVLVAPPAAAQTVDPPRFTVTLSEDATRDTVGSLRWVIDNANGSTAEVIGFDVTAVVVNANILSNTTSATIERSGVEPVFIRAAGIDAANIVILDVGGSLTTVTVRDLHYEVGQIVIQGTNTLFYEVTGERDITTTASLQGPGIFTKSGTGTLRLGAASGLTGVMSVSGGTLVGDTNSIVRPVSVLSGALLSFDQASDASYDFVVSGAGALEKTGGGTLTLTTAQTNTGGTILSGGVLLVGATGDLSDDGAITIATGRLEYQKTGPKNFTGLLSGSGTFDKNNLGAALSFADGDFTGTLRIRDGQVTDNANAIRGNVELDVASSVMIFNGSGTNSGAISGLGSVEKDGPGTVTLTGNNSYAGLTIVRGGTLSVTTNSLPANSANLIDVSLEATGTTLVFDQDFDGSYDGAIITFLTPTDFVKRGTGSVSLEGSSATSSATIEAGRLDVNGSTIPGLALGLSAESIQVEAQGVLGGSGRLSSSVSPLTIRGTLAPGSPIGTLTVVGPVVFEPGATLEAYLTPSGGGRAIATGSVDLGGVGVALNPQPGTYPDQANRVEVDLLTASALNGSCVDTTPNFAFLDHAIEQPMGTLAFTCGQGGTTLTAAIWDNGRTFSDYAVTPNQRSVANALDTMTVDPNSDLGTIEQNFSVLTVAEVNPTLNAISGEYLSQFSTTRLAIGEHFQRTLQRRVRDGLREVEAFWSLGANLDLPALAGLSPRPSAIGQARGVGSLLPMAATSVRVDPVDERRRSLGLWFDGYGLFGKVDGDGNSSTNEYTLWGASLGLDGEPAPGWTVGGAFGYARTSFDVSRLASEGNGNTFQTALYGGYTVPRFRGGAAFRYAYTDNGGSRRIVFSDIDRTAQTSFGSNDYGLRLEGGASVLRWRKLTLEPALAFDWLRLSQPAYIETGADSLNLEVEALNLDSIVLQLGANFRGRIDMDEDTVMLPELRVFWLHEFGDVDRILRGRISGATSGGAFAVAGADLPRDVALIGLGWGASLGANSELVLSWDALVGSGILQNDLTLSFRYRF